MVTREEARKYGIPYYGEPEPTPKKLVPPPETAEQETERMVRRYPSPPFKPVEEKPWKEEVTPKEIKKKSLEELRTVLVSPYYRQQEKARYAQSQMIFRKQLGKVPFGYTLKETPEGYDVQKASPEFVEAHKGKLIPTFGVTPREEKVSKVIGKLTRWTPEELAYEATRYTPFEQKIRMYERMPPVYREILATSQAAFSVAAFPVTLPAVLIGKPFPETRVTPTGAIGATISDALSGKGKEWEYIKKHPAGGIAATVGEIVGGVGIAPIFTPVGKIARFGIKGVIKRIPPVYKKAVGVFPRISKVGETTFAKHLYKWGAKGWKPGVRLAPGTHVPERIPLKLGEAIFKKVPYKRGERVWMSPSQYTKAQRDLAKILSQKGLKIDFPTVKTVEKGAKVIGTMRYEKYVLKGLFKPKVYRYGLFVREGKPIFQKTSIYWKAAPSEYGGFIRRGVKATGVIPKKETYVYGFKGTPYETLKGFTTPLPKKAVQKITTRKIPGLFSVGELEPPSTIYRPISIGVPRTGMIPGTITVPSFISPITPLAYAYFGTTLGALAKTQKRDVGRITIPSSIKKREVAFARLPISTQISKLGVTPTTKMELADLTISIQKQEQLVGLRQKQETITPQVQKGKITLVKPTRYDYVFATTPTIPLIPLVPLPGLFGRGRRFLDLELYGKKYKFRKSDIAWPSFIKIKPIKGLIKKKGKK